MNLQEQLESFLNAYRNGKTSEEFKIGARFGAMWVADYLQDALRGISYSLKEKPTMENGDFLASHVADTYGDEGRQEFSISLLHEVKNGEISVDHAVRWILNYFTVSGDEKKLEAEKELVSARDMITLGDTIDGRYRLTYNRSNGFLDVWRL